jgi:hypothetical protein
MTMTPDVLDLFDLPEKPPRSKLEPYRALIGDLRHKHWSYREIAALFAESLSLTVAPSTLHNFVKVRAVGKVVPAIPAPASQPLRQAAAPVRGRNDIRDGKSQLFEFTSGEALKLSPGGRDGK